jgi:hypothetical protein
MQGRIATPRTRRWRLASLSRPGRSGSAAALGRPNCSLPLPLGRLPPRAPLIRLPPRAALRTTHQCVRPALEQPATHNARPRQQRMRRPIRLPSLSVHPITIPRTPIPHRLSMTLTTPRRRTQKSPRIRHELVQRQPAVTTRTRLLAGLLLPLPLRPRAHRCPFCSTPSRARLSRKASGGSRKS